MTPSFVPVRRELQLADSSMQDQAQLVGDLVVIVPAGVAVAICSALVWYWRSRRQRDANETRDDAPAPRRGGRNDVP